MQDLASSISSLLGACEVCHAEPFGYVVTLTFKPEFREKHEGNPDCQCDVKPLKAYLCETCKDRAVQCAAGKCDEGGSCEIESIRVQTEVEAADEALTLKAAELGVTPQALRFSMAYRMGHREATTVLSALEQAGIPVDFSKLKPTIGEGVRSYPHSASSDEPAGMAAESGQRGKDGSDSESPPWPKPIVFVPNDGNVH